MQAWIEGLEYQLGSPMSAKPSDERWMTRCRRECSLLPPEVWKAGRGSKLAIWGSASGVNLVLQQANAIRKERSRHLIVAAISSFSGKISTIRNSHPFREHRPIRSPSVSRTILRTAHAAQRHPRL